jgi:hypothetical protein
VETTPPACSVEPVSLDCDCKRCLLDIKLKITGLLWEYRFILQFCMHIMGFAVMEVYENIGRIKDLALWLHKIVCLQQSALAYEILPEKFVLRSLVYSLESIIIKHLHH